MKPIVSIIMGSTSDLPVMEAAAKFLNEMQIPFEMNALSAHRTPDKVMEFARNAKERGIKVIIAAAGMAAHLPGVIAAMTPLPVIGVPIKASIENVLEEIKDYEPADVSVATLLFKPAALKKQIKIDYVGIEIPNDFIVGYGLDYDGLGRNLKDIYKIVT